MAGQGTNGGEPVSTDGRLNSWKEIASFLGRGVSTVQRWEKLEGLPVHRLQHSRGGSVYAYPAEIEDWRKARGQHRWMTIFLRWGLPAAALVLLALFFTRPGPAPHPLPAVLPLTAFPGFETTPSLSPDGGQVAFVWRRSGDQWNDLYVMPVQSAVNPQAPGKIASRVTMNAFPRWSPDGARIAFLRMEEGQTWIKWVGSNGGPEHRLAHIGPRTPGYDGTLTSMAWHPHSDGIAVIDREQERDSGPYSVFLVPLNGSGRKRLSAPPGTWFGDIQCAFSPDGRTLALARYQSGTEADVVIVEAGLERTLARLGTYINGLTWSPDGKSIIVSAPYRTAISGLWRIWIDGREKERLTGSERSALHPSVARSVDGGMRVAYASTDQTINIHHWEVEKPAGTIEIIGGSTKVDVSVSVSPDGEFLAFGSTRSGTREIWTSRSDGTGAKQLTSIGSGYSDAPRWSPDQQLLVFTLNSSSNRDLFLVPTSGGAVRQLTNSPSDEGRGSFSRDGKRIFFRSDRSGRGEIWSMPVTGGAPVQLTRNGGYEAFEGPDGRIYFTKARTMLGIWSIPAEGGEEQHHVPDAREGLWGVAKDGLYYLDLYHPLPAGTALYRWSFARKRTEKTGLIPGRKTVWSGLGVSQDGKHIYFSQTVASASDLMKLELVYNDRLANLFAGLWQNRPR